MRPIDRVSSLYGKKDNNDFWTTVMLVVAFVPGIMILPLLNLL